MPKRQPTITNKMLLQHWDTGCRKLRTGLRREFRRLGWRIDNIVEDVTGLRAHLAELKRNDEKTLTLIQRLDDLDTAFIERLRNHNQRLVRLERPATHAA